MSYGGKLKELDETSGEFVVAAALAVAIVFCVLSIFFGGVLTPLVIMASIPLGAAGSLFWLYFRGGTLNVFSGVGLLLVAGLVAKNGILLVDFARRAEAEGRSRSDAIAEAVARRLRPILMTSGAILLGMLPISFGLGHGGEQLAAMGQTIVAGVLASTLLSLVLIPALYACLPAARQPAGEEVPRTLAEPVAQPD